MNARMNGKTWDGGLSKYRNLIYFNEIYSILIKTFDYGILYKNNQQIDRFGRNKYLHLYLINKLFTFREKPGTFIIRKLPVCLNVTIDSELNSQIKILTIFKI